MSDFQDKWWWPLSEYTSVEDKTQREEAKEQGPHPFNVFAWQALKVYDSSIDHFVGAATDEWLLKTRNSVELRYFFRGGSLDAVQGPDVGWLVGNINGHDTDVVFAWCDESNGRENPEYVVEHRWRNPHTLTMERGSRQRFLSQWDAWLYATLLHMTLLRVHDTVLHSLYRDYDMTQEWEG